VVAEPAAPEPPPVAAAATGVVTTTVELPGQAVQTTAVVVNPAGGVDVLIGVVPVQVSVTV